MSSIYACPTGTADPAGSRFRAHFILMLGPSTSSIHPRPTECVPLRARALAWQLLVESGILQALANRSLSPSDLSRQQLSDSPSREHHLVLLITTPLSTIAKRRHISGKANHVNKITKLSQKMERASLHALRRRKMGRPKLRRTPSRP